MSKINESDGTPMGKVRVTHASFKDGNLGYAHKRTGRTHSKLVGGST